MSLNAGLFCVEKKYSYQHIQGVMLVNLNRLAYEINLHHTAYRVAGFLISNYNINSNTAYPSIETISKACMMSKSTVIKNIETLVNNGLIIAVKESGKLTRYLFTKKIMAGLTGTSWETITSTTCKTSHDMKQIEKEQNKSSNDVLFKYHQKFTTGKITLLCYYQIFLSSIINFN